MNLIQDVIIKVVLVGANTWLLVRIYSQGDDKAFLRAILIHKGVHVRVVAAGSRVINGASMWLEANAGDYYPEPQQGRAVAPTNNLCNRVCIYPLLLHDKALA